MEDKQFTVYFVRHGQTLFNTTHQTQGWSDSPLTEEGIAQAHKLKELFENKIDKAYSSSSERAMDTCEIIVGGRNFYYTKLFKEMNFGLLEGFVERRAGTLRKHIELSQGYEDVKGESAESLNKRIQEGLELIAGEAEDNDRILVVTHGIYIMYLIAMFNDFSFLDFIQKKKGPISNGSLTILQYKNGKYKMQAYDTTDYNLI
ncbi:MAG: histidine phosphatase family protein [Erysipelotrichaceae bacterium]|nr:histidine phosphatase family protein [Erysipelotrichaceae bacterium]